MLTFTHGSSDGRGAQMRVTREWQNGDESAHFVVELLPQDGEEYSAEGRRYQFSERGKVGLSLDAYRAAHVLRLLHGSTCSLLEGRGVTDAVKEHGVTTVMHMERETAEKNGEALYRVHIVSYRSDCKRECRIALNCTEAFALMKAMEACMGEVAFGI